MLKVFGKKLKKTFVVLLISYMLILIIPLWVGIIAYYQAEDIIEQEVAESNNAMLKQFRQVIDSNLQELDQVAAQIAVNPQLLNLAYIPNISSFDHRYQIAQTLQLLNSYRKAFKFVDDFYIYFSASDMILASSGKWDTQTFYDNVYFYQDMEYSEWLGNILSKKYYKQYIYQKAISADRLANEMVTYMQTAPIGTQGDSYVNICLLVNKQKLKTLLSSIGDSDKRVIYILDDNSNVVVSSDSAQELNDSYNDYFQQMNSADYGTIYDGENVIAYVSSQQLKWKYMIITPRDVFMAKVKNIRSMTLLVVLICLVIGIIAAYFMAYRNYNPIKKLINNLTAKTGQDLPKADNEYEFIEKTFNTIYDSNKELKNWLFDQMPVLKMDFLRKLLRGGFSNYDTLIDSLDFYNVHFPGERFLVLVFHIDDYNKFINDDSEHERILVRFIITNVVEEMADRYGKGYMADMDERKLAMVVCFSDCESDETLLDNVRHMIAEAQEFIKKEFSIFFSVSIGDIVNGIEFINESYRNAEAAMDYRIVSGNNSVICFSDLGNRNDVYYYSIEEETQLINCIRVGDAKKATELLDYIFIENFNDKKLSFSLLRCLFFDIMSSAIKVLAEIGLNYSDIFGIDMDPIKQLSDCDTVDVMHMKLKHIYQTICEYINSNKKSHNDGLKNRILNVIDENYADPDLSLSFIAERIDMNPAYISHFFKEQTGYTIVEHINRVRIGHAKKLLKSTDDSIACIARKTGYNNDTALIKAFKKYEGVTPGRYKTATG